MLDKGDGINKKIAFVDIDNCLISNSTSKYNEELIKYLKAGGFDQIWLVTGRTTQDIKKHILGYNNNPPADWKNQLLINIEKNLKDRGDVNLTGISTPHDHGRVSAKYDPGTGRKECGYTAVEEELEKFAGELEKFAGKDNLVGNFFDSSAKVQESGAVDSAIAINLATTSDTEKKGQITHLIDSLKLDAQNIQAEVFDDKSENVRSITGTLENLGFQVEGRVVDFTNGNEDIDVKSKLEGAPDFSSPTPLPLNPPASTKQPIYKLTATDTKGSDPTMCVEMVVDVFDKSQITYENLCSGPLSYKELTKKRGEAETYVSDNNSGKTLSQFTIHIECDGMHIAPGPTGFHIDDNLDSGHNWKFHLSIDRSQLGEAFDLLYKNDLLADMPYLKVSYKGEASTADGKEITIYGCHNDMTRWQAALQKIEDFLSQNGIKKGPKPEQKGDKVDYSVEGSDYFHYRITNSELISNEEIKGIEGIDLVNRIEKHEPESDLSEDGQLQAAKAASIEAEEERKKEVSKLANESNVAIINSVISEFRHTIDEAIARGFRADSDEDGEIVTDSLGDICSKLEGDVTRAIEEGASIDNLNFESFKLGRDGEGNQREVWSSFGDDGGVKLEIGSNASNLESIEKFFRRKLFNKAALDYKASDDYQGLVTKECDKALNRFLENKDQELIASKNPDLNAPITIDSVKESGGVVSDLNNKVQEHVAAFQIAVEENFDNPKPTTPYRGIGVKAKVSEDRKSLNVSEIFSAGNGRFSIDVNVLKDSTITAVWIGDNYQKISDLLAQEGGLKKIAAAFHGDGEVKFKIKKGDVESEVTCDNSQNKTAIYSAQDSCSLSELKTSDEERFNEVCNQVVQRGGLFTNYWYNDKNIERFLVKNMRESGYDMQGMRSKIINNNVLVTAQAVNVVSDKVEDIKNSINLIFSNIAKEYLNIRPFRIIYPANLNQGHWVTGEIVINENGMQSFMHDSLSKNTELDYTPNSLFQQVLQEKFDVSFDLEQKKSAYGERQSDFTSCGAITAREMVKRVFDGPLNDIYPHSSPDLRISDFKNGFFNNEDIEKFEIDQIFSYNILKTIAVGGGESKYQYGSLSSKIIHEDWNESFLQECIDQMEYDPFDNIENKGLIKDVYASKKYEYRSLHGILEESNDLDIAFNKITENNFIKDKLEGGLIIADPSGNKQFDANKEGMGERCKEIREFFPYDEIDEGLRGFMYKGKDRDGDGIFQDGVPDAIFQFAKTPNNDNSKSTSPSATPNPNPAKTDPLQKKGGPKGVSVDGR